MILTKKILLASGSPRRREILSQSGFEFDIEVRETSELFPDDIAPENVPEFLALKKAEEFKDILDDTLVITSDTVVILDSKILNKPADAEEAYKMLKSLSGKMHKVVTGVCIKDGDNFETFADIAYVYFSDLTDQEIQFYIQTCKPFDKAGSYGVQDFIGMIGIEKIEGSYYTIMGLPIHKLYKKLKKYAEI